MLIYKEGDVLDSPDLFILHQVNCQGRMNSGVAKQIREKYPKAYTQYKILCDSYGSELLGEYQAVYIDGELKCIINAFGQDRYGYDDKKYTDYNALENIFTCLNKDLQYWSKENEKMKISMPKIGCGLGGGDWNIIENIISDKMENDKFLITIYTI